METEKQELLSRFGQAVREHRFAQGISQEELGYRAQLDRTYISGIERGIRNPSLTAVVRLAEGLGIAPAVLLQNMDKAEGTL